MTQSKRELFYEKMRELEFHKNKNLFLGIILTIVAWISSALANMCITLTLGNVAPQTALFFQYLFAFLPFFFIVLKHGMQKIKTTQFPLIVLRSIFGIANNLLLFISFQFIPFLDASLLNNTSPLFIPIIMWIWIGKKMPLKQWIGIIIGFVGIVFMINPHREILAFASILALISGIFAGLSKASLRILANEHYITILFYYLLFSFISMVPFIFIKWEPISLNSWFFLIFAGVFLLLSQLAFTFSLKYACAADVAPFNFTFVLASGIIGWIVWHYVPDLIGFVGIFLIIVGGVWAILSNKTTPSLT